MLFGQIGGSNREAGCSGTVAAAGCAMAKGAVVGVENVATRDGSRGVGLSGGIKTGWVGRLDRRTQRYPSKHQAKCEGDRKRTGSPIVPGGCRSYRGNGADADDQGQRSEQDLRSGR